MFDFTLGDRAKQLFENLKKRFSKRRNDLKKAERSGTSTSAVEKAKESMREYSFLVWLIPYIKLRATKTNVPPASIEKATPISPTPTIDTGSIVDEQDYDDANFYDEVTSEGQCFNENIEETPKNMRKRSGDDISKVTGQEKWSKKKPDLDKEELSVLKSLQKAFESPQEEPKKDDIDLFGMLVSAELRKLGKREQRLAKHQIQNVIFTLQTQQEDDSVRSFNPSPSLRQTTYLQPSASFHQPAAFQTGYSLHPYGTKTLSSPFNPPAPVFHPGSLLTDTSLNQSTWNANSQGPPASQSFQVICKSASD